MTAFGSCHYSLCLLYSSMGAPQVQGYFNFNKRNLFQCPKVFHKQNFNVFSATPFKIDQTKNQNRSIDNVRNLGNERRQMYKDPRSQRFRSQEYSVYEIFEMFYPNLQRFVCRRHAGAHLDGHQHGGRKPTKTSVTEFLYKSVNLFLEEFINIKVILFLIHELLRQQNSPKNVPFLTYMTALSAVM